MNSVAIFCGVAPEILCAVIENVKVIVRLQRDEADMVGLFAFCVSDRYFVAVQRDEAVVGEVVVRYERLMVSEGYRAVTVSLVKRFQLFRSFFPSEIVE